LADDFALPPLQATLKFLQAKMFIFLPFSPSLPSIEDILYSFFIFFLVYDIALHTLIRLIRLKFPLLLSFLHTWDTFLQEGPLRELSASAMLATEYLIHFLFSDI